MYWCTYVYSIYLRSNFIHMCIVASKVLATKVAAIHKWLMYIFPTEGFRWAGNGTKQSDLFNLPYSWKCLRGIKFCSLRFWQESANIMFANMFDVCYSHEVSTMSLLRYFSQTSNLPSSGYVPSLRPEALHEANKRVASLSRQPNEPSLGPKRAKNCSYSAEDCARIVPSTGQPKHRGISQS